MPTAKTNRCAPLNAEAARTHLLILIIFLTQFPLAALFSVGYLPPFLLVVAIHETLNIFHRLIFKQFLITP